MKGGTKSKYERERCVVDFREGCTPAFIEVDTMLRGGLSDRPFLVGAVVGGGHITEKELRGSSARRQGVYKRSHRRGEVVARVRVPTNARWTSPTHVSQEQFLS